MDFFAQQRGCKLIISRRAPQRNANNFFHAMPPNVVNEWFLAGRDAPPYRSDSMSCALLSIDFHLLTWDGGREAPTDQPFRFDF